MYSLKKNKYKKIVLLLSFSILPLCASEAPQNTAVTQEILIIQQEFECYKAWLPKSLYNFITDFATWSKEDKANIAIFGLSFSVSGLSDIRKADYEGNVGLWIDCRTQTQEQRELCIACLKHLQK